MARAFFTVSTLATVKDKGNEIKYRGLLSARLQNQPRPMNIHTAIVESSFRSLRFFSPAILRGREVVIDARRGKRPLGTDTKRNYTIS